MVALAKKFVLSETVLPHGLRSIWVPLPSLSVFHFFLLRFVFLHLKIYAFLPTRFNLSLFRTLLSSNKSKYAFFVRSETLQNVFNRFRFDPDTADLLA